MTLPTVAAARFACLLIAGDDKRAAYDRACEGGPLEAMPVRAILGARPDLWVAWAP